MQGIDFLIKKGELRLLVLNLFQYQSLKRN